jgi:hypothetical protein
MFPEPRRIVPDSAVRAGLNTDSATLAACRIVRDHTLTDSVRLVTAATQKPKGVTMGSIEVGLTGDIQIAGKAVIETGASYAKGVNIGADSVGRAVEVSAPGDYVIGTAVEASGGAGELREVELA